MYSLARAATNACFYFGCPKLQILLLYSLARAATHVCFYFGCPKLQIYFCILLPGQQLTPVVILDVPSYKWHCFYFGCPKLQMTLFLFWLSQVTNGTVFILVVPIYKWHAVSLALESLYRCCWNKIGGLPE